MSPFSSIMNGARRAGRALSNAVQPLMKTDPKAPNTPMAAPAAAAGQAAAPAPVGVAPAAPAAPQPTAASADGTSVARGFTLPDLGPAPDPNAPQYADEAGKQAYADDLAAYQHKQEIHQNFMDLDAIFQKLHPQRDFQGEYAQEVAAQQQHEGERPHPNGLARAALALGDMNPAVKESNLATYDKGMAEAQSASDKSFTQRMMLRQKMHEQAAEQAMSEGNWKKALAENEKLALLKADEDTLKHKRDMEKTNATIKGANTRAQIRADALQTSAHIRAAAIAQQHGLKGAAEATFLKEAAKQLAKFVGPQDLNKTYDMADLDTITSAYEDLAEQLAHPGTHTPKPAGTPAPKSTEKEQF